MNYNYPKISAVSPTTGICERPLFWEYFVEFARMKYEQGADCEEIQKIINEVEQTVKQASVKLCALADDPLLAAEEPNKLDDILKKCLLGKENLWETLNEDLYAKKLKGSVLGRFAGCTLGAPVEFWSVEDMKSWASYCKQSFPPKEYWLKTKNPNDLRYEASYTYEYEKDNIHGVPVDDDITYPILCLLIMEAFGTEFTTNEAAKVWKKELPRACTAEEVVLNNLEAGIDALHAAETDNPYQQWIGADIRADAFGWAAPAMPLKAAEMAFNDAYLTHRRNGIYGEMYYAAVLSAAFALNNVKAALEEGLKYIPVNSLLYKDVRWAIDTAPNIKDYADARLTAEKYFGGMSGVHTNLNAALTIFGLLTGGKDFTKIIGDVTAMGYDNDCNAATAGSIFGAAYGIDAIPEKWYTCFEDTVYTYLNSYPKMSINDILSRIKTIAKSLYQ